MNSPLLFIWFYPNHHDFPSPTQKKDTCWTNSKLKTNKKNMSKSPPPKKKKKHNTFQLNHILVFFTKNILFCFGTNHHHHHPPIIISRPWAWSRPIFWPSPTNVAWAHHHPTFPRPGPQDEPMNEPRMERVGLGGLNVKPRVDRETKRWLLF